MTELDQRESKSEAAQAQTSSESGMKGDYARGMRTLPATQGSPDFARGERTLLPRLEGPDYARGLRSNLD